ncbi:MAG: LamG domain-containing protein, partial [Candidatus Marinimicrobia bacterium]|nr:LamG domain-containing protein [Candidatus Neomarinimicrobiota bacterium]
MKTAFKFQKNARKLNVCLIGAIGLIPALISAQFCEPNYSVPYSTINMSVYTEKSINNQYSTFMTVGQPFIVHNESIPTNYAIHSTVTGFWSHYMNEPRPPLVSASDGDFQDIVLVKWVVEDDRTGPPVTGNTVTLYRNGYVLTQLPVEQTEFQDLYVFPGEYYTYGVTSSNTMGTSHTQNDIGFLNPNGVITGYISTPTGAPMLDAKVLLTPNLGQSAEFNGDGYIFFFDDGEVIDGVEIPPANLQFSGLDSSYTIETWFRTVEPGPQAIFSALVPDAEDEQYVYIGLNDAGQVIWQHQSFDADAIAEIVSEDIIPEPGEWHHIALVFNGDDYDMTMYDVNSMTMYLDGDLVDTKESVSSIGPGNDAEILLGKADHVSTTNYFSGYLDDFRLWSVPRSWEDLRKYIDITLSGEETGLEAYWKFDEIEGETIFDLTNNDIDGTICRVEHDNLTAPVYVGALTDATGN